MNKRIGRRISRAAVLLLIFVVAALPGVALRCAIVEVRQREAENILFYYREKILLQMQGTMNEADSLAQTAYVMEMEQPDQLFWFERAAGHLLKRPEVCFAFWFEGDTLASALPRDEFGDLTGSGLQDFSYIYTMAKVVKDLVVEGPIVMEHDNRQQEVFLFLKPVVEEGAYLGQVWPWRWIGIMCWGRSVWMSCTPKDMITSSGVWNLRTGTRK